MKNFIAKEEIRAKAVELVNTEKQIAKEINDFAVSKGYSKYTIEDKEISKKARQKLLNIYPSLTPLNVDIIGCYGNVLSFDKIGDWRNIEDCANNCEVYLLRNVYDFQKLENEPFDYYSNMNSFDVLRVAIGRANKVGVDAGRLYKYKYISMNNEYLTFLDKELEKEFLNIIYFVSEETQSIIDYIKLNPSIIKAYRKNNDINNFIKKHLKAEVIDKNCNYYFKNHITRYNTLAIEKFLREEKAKK